MMTLEELNAARDAATRDYLLENDVLTKVRDLLSLASQIGAVGQGAANSLATLAHLERDISAFLTRTAPQGPVDAI